MSISDKFTFQNSLETDENDYVFDSKQFVYVPDQNNGSYPSGQIRFDATALSNSGKMFDPLQSFITVPLVLQVSGTFAQSGANVFAASLKNGYHNLINSISVELGNNQIVNTTNLTNLDINYQLLTTMTQDSLQNFGSSIGFSPDTHTSIGYAAAANANGVGEYNNVITDALFAANGSFSGTKNAINSGRAERMMSTSFDPATLSFPSINAARCNSSGKSYSVTNIANVLNYYILATIPLRILHDVFRKLPLMRNAYFRSN